MFESMTRLKPSMVENLTAVRGENGSSPVIYEQLGELCKKEGMFGVLSPSSSDD